MPKKDNPANTHLTGALAWILRGVWLFLAAISLAYFILAWVDVLGQPLKDCLAQPVDCNPMDLSVKDIAVMGAAGGFYRLVSKVALGIMVAANFVYLMAAAIIFLRKSNDWMALLISATLFILGAVGYSPSPEDSLPGFVFIVELLALPGYILPIILLYLFPDGKFVPRWTRYLVYGLILFILLYSFLWGLEVLPENSRTTGVVTGVFAISIISGALVGVFSVIYRYRQAASWQQRQQIKWVAFGFLGAISGVVSYVFFSTVFPVDQPSPARTIAISIAYITVLPLISLFPVCVMIAVLRYRLFEIDRIIRRTLLYSLLTVLLALIYFGSVLLLQTVFRTFTDQDSQVAIIFSTLAIAALFNPLRSRLQRFIDRRFYRQRYDAALILANFGESLRNEVDLEALSDRLVAVVGENMQPEHISLWLREKGG
jgi:hypothetical protein